jgi:deoxycytidylate deaminase
MSSKIEFYKNAAYAEALKSPMNKRIGAILVHRNKIISRGHNYYNMSTVRNINIFLFSTHAEVDCINKCKSNKKQLAVIYIIRVDKNGDILPITPCDNCKKVIEHNVAKYVCF